MLRPRPNRILTNDTRKKKNKLSISGYVLATIPIHHSPPVHKSALVAVGSKIYNISGSTDSSPSSSVSILDCLSHTWLQAPSMQVEREYPTAKLLDGKVYVTGGCSKHYDPSNWMEVLDLKTETWEPVLSRVGRLRLYGCHDHTNNVVIDGKLYIFGDKGVAYNPNDGTWNSLGSEMDLGLQWSSACVIEDVLYYYHEDEIKWYDTKARSWRTLNGIKKLPKFAYFANVRLADYGGKMAFFWDKFVASGGGGGWKNRMIWCAMIALERRNSEEIWGKIEWFHRVLPHPVPVEYAFEYVAAVNI